MDSIPPAVEKYIYPEEMALRAEADRRAQEQRKRAEADDLKQRALREMMNGSLHVKKEPTALENMVGRQDRDPCSTMQPCTETLIDCLDCFTPP
jgi:hypothetical protein